MQKLKVPGCKNFRDAKIPGMHEKGAGMQKARDAKSQDAKSPGCKKAGMQKGRETKVPVRDAKVPWMQKSPGCKSPFLQKDEKVPGCKMSGCKLSGCKSHLAFESILIRF